jgi:hypothetical protein
MRRTASAVKRNFRLLRIAAATDSSPANGGRGEPGAGQASAKREQLFGAAPAPGKQQ